MTTLTVTMPLPAADRVRLAGRPFVSTAFDWLFVAGGWSFLAVPLLPSGMLAGVASTAWLPLVVLLTTSAHVGASTVRLYTKRGSQETHRFLSRVFPLVTVGVMTVAIAFPEAVGRHIQALYLTWNPYHYAAQAYGIAVMYCYRSGCRLDDTDKKLLRTACLVPFLLAFVKASGAGLEWLAPASILNRPEAGPLRYMLVRVLTVVTFAAPAALFVRLNLQRKVGMPLVSLLTVVANGVWWVSLQYANAFVWATIFHGVQYLAISVIFHVKDQMQRPDNQAGWLSHSLRFYAMSAGLAYCLFHAWPLAYVLVGFGWVESIFLTSAVLSLHHVVVDAYIWRLRRDPNYGIVTAGAVAPA